MKRILLLASLSLLALCGCSSTNIAELTKALASDPATVRFHVTSIYGTVDYTRVGSTNGLTVAPDGTITVK